MIDCSECGEETELHPIQQQNRKPEEWGVPESCGALKVKPMKDLIEDKEFDVLITGVRKIDPLADTDDHKAK